MESKNRIDGERFERYDHNSKRNEIYRINPITGVEETLVQGALCNYWQDSSRIIRNEGGMVIDLEG